MKRLVRAIWRTAPCWIGGHQGGRWNHQGERRCESCLSWYKP